LFKVLLIGILSVAVSSIEVGESIPSDVSLHVGFPPELVPLKERVAGKNVLIVGLPGAFTPT